MPNEGKKDYSDLWDELDEDGEIEPIEDEEEDEPEMTRTFDLGEDGIMIARDLETVGEKPKYEPTLGFYPIIASELSPLIDEKHDAVVLGRGGGSHNKYGLKGTMDLGVVTEKQVKGTSHFGKKVLFDAEFPHIVFICGKRGSGKSYTLGVLAEEIARSNIGVGVVLVDPIGIFWSMRLANQNAAEVEILEKWGLKPQALKGVKVMAPIGFYKDMEGTVDSAFSITTADLSVEDWCLVFDVDRFKAQGLCIQDAITSVLDGYQAKIDNQIVEVPPVQHYSIGDLIQCLSHGLRMQSKAEGHAPATRRSVIARFRAAAAWGLFSRDGTPISEISKPNKVTVIDVSHAKLGEAKRALIVGILGRKILEGRIQTSRLEDARKVGMKVKKSSIIPVTWLLIDEAHLLLPHTGETAATKPLVEYAKLGRKPGCGLVLATQRPAATNDDILPQVDMLIAHNLALEDDMTALRRRIPAKVPPQIVSSDFIRGIPVGVGVIADQKTQRRAFVSQLRPRLTHHSGKASVPGLVLEDGSVMGMVEVDGEVVKPYNPRTELKPTHSLTTKVEETEEKEEPVEEPEAEEPAPAAEEPPSEDSLEWGCTYLIKESGTDRGYELFNEGFAVSGRGMIVSRVHPSKLKRKVDLPEGTKFVWLSKTSSDMSVAPGNLQALGMEINAFIKEEENSVVVLDGMEYLLSNNDFSSMLHLFESVNDKVVLNQGRFLVSMNPSCLDSKQLSMLEEEMDDVIDAECEEEVCDEPLPPPPDDELMPSAEAQAELVMTMEKATKPELQDVCRKYGLKVSGKKEELKWRILQYYKEMERRERDYEDSLPEPEDDVVEEPPEPEGFEEEDEELDWDEDLPSEIKKEMEQKENAAKKALEAERRERERELAAQKKAMEAEQKARERELEKVRKEVERERIALERAKKKEEQDKIRAREQAAAKREKELERKKAAMEKERLRREKEMAREQERLKKEHERKLAQERKALEAEMKRKQAEAKKAAAAAAKKKPKAEIEELKPTVIPKGRPQPPKRVVKTSEPIPGIEIQAIPPKHNEAAATSIAQQNLKKELLFKVVEKVLRTRLVYAPIYRIYCRKTTGILMFKKEKQTVVFVDGLTGDVILTYRKGLKRTSGAAEVYKLPPNQMLVILHIGKGRTVEAIAQDAHLAVAETKRALTALIKKGVVVKEFKESFTEKGKGVDIYSTSFDLNVPTDITTVQNAIPPSAMFKIKEDILGTVFTEKEVVNFVNSVDPSLKILGMDLVYFPYYMADLVDKRGHRRVLMIDGITNRIDDDAEVGYTRLLLQEREAARKKKRK